VVGCRFALRQVLWITGFVHASLSPGCTSDVAELEIRVEPGDCSSEELSQSSMATLEVYGAHDGALCVLGQRCLFDVNQPLSTSDIEDVLMDVPGPLLTLARPEDVKFIALIGHAKESCSGYDDQTFCGFADVADLRGDSIELSLTCSLCSDENIPLCP
jgi:hypothetical protein